MKPTKLLAIDTGPESSAYVSMVYNPDRKRLEPKEADYLENSLFMQWMWNSIMGFDHVACEGLVVYDHAGKLLIDTVIMSGRVKECAMRSGVPISYVTVNQQKVVLCQRIMKITRASINAQVKRRFGIGTKKEPGILDGLWNRGQDIKSAIAVGVAWEALYPTGDLNGETFIPDMDALPGDVREYRVGDRQYSQAELDRAFKFEEGEVVEQGEFVKCGLPNCQGSEKGDTCKCPLPDHAGECLSGAALAKCDGRCTNALRQNIKLR